MLTKHEVLDIRKRCFKQGKSIREISRETGRDRKTVRMYIDKEGWEEIKPRSFPNVEFPKLEPYKVDINAWLIEDRRLGASRPTARQIYQRLVGKYTESFNCSYRTVTGYIANNKKANHRKQEETLDSCHIWVYKLLQGELNCKQLEEQLSETLDTNTVRQLHRCVLNEPLRNRNRAITILAYSSHFAMRSIARSLFLNRKTVRNYVQRFESGGSQKLFDMTRNEMKKYENPEYADKLFEALHTPPSTYGINRTTWRMEDLCLIMRQIRLPISRVNIRKILKTAGYRILKAKRVLTSNDPQYKEKVEKITAILSNLKPNEKFFSIDEFGPFAVKLQGGRSWVPPGQNKTFPQWQKSKGSLLVTGALELSTNQITHFYSSKKNTSEMIKLLNTLLDQYKEEDCIYLSWDAASWHLSKKLNEMVEMINTRTQGEEHTGPRVSLVPLPSSAQFLNVIESVYSGMSRAILHNSDYVSVDDCKKAISDHFAKRNQYFKENPKRAGKKIWGKEITPSRFSPSNNCKDPRYSYKG